MRRRHLALLSALAALLMALPISCAGSSQSGDGGADGARDDGRIGFGDAGDARLPDQRVETTPRDVTIGDGDGDLPPRDGPSDGPRGDGPRGDGLADGLVDGLADGLADSPRELGSRDGPRSDAGGDGAVATCIWVDVAQCATGKKIVDFCPTGRTPKRLRRCNNTIFTGPSFQSYISTYDLCSCAWQSSCSSQNCVVWQAVECCL